MRILYYELRKIWRPSILLVLALLGTMYYFLLMDYNIRNFPHGHPHTELYALLQQWTETYGTTLEPDEYEDAKREYMALVAEADAKIAADPQFQACGIASWAQFRERWQDEEFLMAFWETGNRLYSETYEFIGYRLETAYSALDSYDWAMQHSDTAPVDSGIFPWICTENLSEYMIWAIIYAIVSVTILLSAAGARENLSRTAAGLWTTRTGRHVCGYQLGAALLSAVVLFALETLIFGSIYAQLGTQFFWDNPMQTFLYVSALFNLRYGQYVLCFLALALAIMLGTAGMVFVLSRISANYVSAIMKTLPLAVGMIFTAAAVMNDPFTTGNTLYQHTEITGVEALLCGLILAAGLAAGFLSLRHAQRKDLL